MDLAKRQTSKSVYSCLVVGPRDAGKTTICQVPITSNADPNFLSTDPVPDP